MNIINENKAYPNYCEASLFLLTSMLCEFFSERINTVELSANKVKATLTSNKTLMVYVKGLDSFLSVISNEMSCDVYHINKDVDGWIVSGDMRQQHMLMRIE